MTARPSCFFARKTIRLFSTKCASCFGKRPKNCIAESVCYRQNQQTSYSTSAFLFSVSSYPCIEKNTEIMDTCINDLGMVNNTVKLQTKKRWLPNSAFRTGRSSGGTTAVTSNASVSAAVSSFPIPKCTDPGSVRRRGECRRTVYPATAESNASGCYVRTGPRFPFPSMNYQTEIRMFNEWLETHDSPHRALPSGMRLCSWLIAQVGRRR